MKRSSPANAVTLPIDEIEIIPLDIVPGRKRSFSKGPVLYGGPGSLVGRPILLRVSAGGLSGWGEVRPINPWVGETAASMLACLRDFLGPAIVGRDALRIEAILRDCEFLMPANPSALAVLDFALHDLVGKALNVPAHALLGGACRDRIPLEWSVGLADEKSMIEESVMAVQKFGVNYVCIKVGPAERIDADVRTLKAIRAGIGKNVHLGIDANMGYDAVNAVRLVERLSDVNLTYFEQPVARDALRELRWVFDRCNVSVIADESCFSPADAAKVIAEGAADVLALKFYKCGGLRRGRDIATVADASKLRVNCAGTANGSYIEAIAGATLAAAIPNHAFGAEFIMGLPAVDGDEIVANRPVDVRDGYCNIPQGAGLGMEIDEAAVKRHAMSRDLVRKP